MNKLLFREAKTGLLIWLVALIWIITVNVGALVAMFNLEPSFWGEYVSTAKSTVGVLFTGPGIGIEVANVSIPLAILGKLYIMICIAVVIVNANYIVNWNRGFEENSRTELLLALPVKRNSLQKASFFNFTIFNLIVSIAVGVAFIVAGCNVFDTCFLQLAFFLFCEMFLLFSMFVSSLFSVARTAKLVVITSVFITYIIAALGWASAVTSDSKVVDPNFPLYSWISPIHWLFEMKPYYSLTFMPLLIFAGFCVLLIVLNLIVYNNRDMSSSVFDAKQGKSNAGKLLGNMFALRFKLSYKVMFLWGLIIAFISAIYGSLVSSVVDMIQNNEMISQMMKVDPETATNQLNNAQDSAVNGFLGYITMFLLIVVAGYSISNVVSTLNHDENNRIYEVFYATPLKRVKYLQQMQNVFTINMLFVSFAAIFGLGIFASLSANSVSFGQFLLVALVSLLIPLFFTYLTIFLFSISPKITSVSWGYFAFCVVITMFGDILKTPKWLNNVSILQWFGKYPLEWSENAYNLTAIGIIFQLTLVFAFSSLVIYKHRDLQ